MKAGFLLSETIVQRPATMSSKTMPANEVRNLGHYDSAMPIGAIPMSDCKRLVLIAHTKEELEDKAAVQEDVDWPPCFAEPCHRTGFNPATRLWFDCEVCTRFIKKYNRGSFCNDPLKLPSNWRCFGCQQKDMYWRHREIPSALQSLCDQCTTVWQHANPGMTLH